ncbi:hypothetical protein DRN86_00780 [Candidatus Geothermarchaeota archaeon]|nr:MAG: hypothetical protein DRN86_00780 [Candidatus Geothermarchaeota archaeon]
MPLKLLSGQLGEEELAELMHQFEYQYLRGMLEALLILKKRLWERTSKGERRNPIFRLCMDELDELFNYVTWRLAEKADEELVMSVNVERPTPREEKNSSRRQLGSGLKN